MREKLLKFLEETYKIIDLNYPDDEDSDDCDCDGEQIFENGRYQGMYEICKKVESIIKEIEGGLNENISRF